MSLRIVRAGPTLEGVQAGAATAPDSVASRVAKLIPAEALGLYGAGAALVPAQRVDGLWLLAAASLFLAIWVRYLGTRGADGRPQWIAIGVAAVSFCLWVAALPYPAGPLNLGADAFLASLLAFIWGVVTPWVYKGDPAPTA